MPPRISDEAREELRSLFHPDELKQVQLFAQYELFSFIKFFDADVPDDDADNFYMEREWRVIGRVAFTIADIERTFLPRSYATRLRADVPQLVAQITLTNKPPPNSA